MLLDCADEVEHGYLAWCGLVGLGLISFAIGGYYGYGGALLMLEAGLALLWCGSYLAKGKGYSALLGIILFSFPLGIVVLLLLPDKHKR